MASYSLGNLFFNGNGVVQNIAKAVELFEYAAKAGSLDAQYNLGIMYITGDAIEKDLGRARYWLEMAVAQGDLGAKGILDSISV